MNSLAQAQNITCPNCQHTFEFNLWLVVDLTEHPHLLANLQQGTLHTVICPNCHTKLGEADVPILLYNAQNSPVLIFSPAQQTSKEQDQEQFDQLMGYLAQQLQANWTQDWLQQYLQIIPRPGLLQFLSATVSETPSNNLQQLLQQMVSLTQPQQLPQRIIIIQQALQLVDMQTQPQLWGALQVELGNNLLEYPLVNKTNNIEQAIVHYQFALMVLTREAFPEQWAMTQYNLANVYKDHIVGSQAENLERAIEHYQLALAIYTRVAFPQNWAQTQNNLGLAYANRIGGSRAENLERAIEHYQLALTIYTREAFPQDWARTQNNLALAYANRIVGGRTENMERVIEHCQLTLAIYTRQTFPQDWAKAHYNLGTAYLHRIAGSRVENLEHTIKHYQHTLDFYTREAFPQEWAQTQNNLAIAYTNRIAGSRAKNLERAIEHCQLALAIRTRKDFPQDWAVTQNNLANAYSDRIIGSRAENLELAIKHYQMALTILTREDFPQGWAVTQNNLANAYSDRIMGSRAENLEHTIKHCQLALTIRTREDFPQEWALTQNNLANAYSNRIVGSQAENSERAIAHCKLALTIYIRETFPTQWADTQNNLANAYRNSTIGNRVENLERAINHYQFALIIYTLNTFPEQWAGIQHNLANVYFELIEKSKPENLKKAIFHYQQALMIRTYDTFPQDYRQTQRNLGHLYFDNKRWGEVNEPYHAAIKAGKQLLKLALIPESQQAEIRETSGLFARASYTSLKTGQVGSAFFTLEQGKTQLLTQALALYEADVSMLTEEQKAELYTVREGVQVLETELRLPEGSPGRLPTLTLTEQLQQARAELDKVIDNLRGTYPTFMPEGFATLEEVLAVIPPHTTVLAPVVTSHGAAVLVVPHGVTTLTSSHFIWLPTLTDEQLDQWLYGSAEKPGWLRIYGEFLTADKLNQTSKFEALKKGWSAWLHHFGQEFILPIRQKLAELNIVQGSELLFLPQAGLGLLPLHACPYQWQEVEQCLTAEFNIRYTPSLYALQTNQERLAQTGRQAYQLLACINPTKDLPFTPFEGHTLDQLFTPRQQPTLLWEKEAKKQAVIDHISHSNYFHFSGHGMFDWGEVQQSGLVLADKQRLTMTDILTKLNLEQMRLVVLSACETGITDLSQNRDEFLGLPAAFLQAGSPAVLSTLWAVDDLSTTLFMREFYTRHLAGEPLAEALRQSQLWLRNVTGAELVGLVKTLRQQQESAELFKRERHWQENPAVRPFEHPFYWACFVLHGNSA
jgi:CHAT domain-containing protein/tetratricopeptide (TPR) repeat protein